jgi:hypothetical protein
MRCGAARVGGAVDPADGFSPVEEAVSLGLRCVYCGGPAELVVFRSHVCAGHTDLPGLDPNMKLPQIAEKTTPDKPTPLYIQGR